MSLFANLDTMTRRATIVGPYRYTLTRRWGDGRAFVVIGCNPSTADATLDDPTIRRCISFAKLHNCDALEMVNLFAFRATDVRDLGGNHGDVVGPENDGAILAACLTADPLVVCAWGAHAKLPPWLRTRPSQVVAMLRQHEVNLHVLRFTQAWEPMHPLYLPSNLIAFPWENV